MEEAIKKFPQQFEFVPVIENEAQLKKHSKFIVAGMGGSSLGAWLLKRDNPFLDLLLHRDYDLPRVPEYFLKESLLILSSYSGNTEEVLDCGRYGKEHGLSMAVVSDGGELIQFAKDYNLPYIDLPNTGVEPRMAIGFTMIALAKLMQDDALLERIKFAGNRVDPNEGRAVGEDLARILQGKIPLIYSSTINMPIAYNWKIKFNETGKIPAFFNVFPEFNHNELSGFDMLDKNKELNEKFNAIFLVDEEDHVRIKKRMDVMERMFLDRGINVTRIPIDGRDTLSKIFRSVLLGEWVALNVAHYYGEPDAKTPLIAEFKKRMTE
jgi:glucose/mannose-6-phosphate isomerase